MAPLATHPILGLALPIATALNAVNIFRLFARLFLGKPTMPGNSIPDARAAPGALGTFGLVWCSWFGVEWFRPYLLNCGEARPIASSE